MIKCFVINLDHRKDRLKRIRKHLNSNGLYFTRFQAVNALETNSKSLTKNILKDDKSAVMRTDRMWEKSDVLFSSLQIYRGKSIVGEAF